MSRKRTQAETRQAILETAEMLFRQVGYDAVSITEIARHCLMTPGNIYHVFRNKTDIAEAILRCSLQALLSTLDTSDLGGSDRNANASTLVVEVLRHLDPGPDPFLFDLWRRAATEDWGIWKTLLDELRSRLTTHVTRGDGSAGLPLIANATFRAALAFIHPVLIADENRALLEEEALALFSRIAYTPNSS